MGNIHTPWYASGMVSITVMNSNLEWTAVSVPSLDRNKFPASPNITGRAQFWFSLKRTEHLKNELRESTVVPTYKIHYIRHIELICV